ncbi:MAG: flagellar motor protein MotB, partial [Clostridia bacterium]
MKRRIRGYKKFQESDNFWPSFADVMSTIALVMLFLVMIVFIKNIIMSISLDDERDKLSATRLELEDKEIILVIAEEELKEKERLIAVFEEQLINLTDLLSQTEEQMSDKQQIIIILAEQQKQLESIILINTRELQDLRLKLQSIAVLRANIFEKVKNSIEAAMGKTNEKGEELVIIGDNANLYINESLVFDFGSADIKPQGF